jgi:hypothetical protein
MNRKAIEHFTDLVTRTFPNHAEIMRADHDGDFRLIIDWRLGSDPQRPNKRSKSIELCISEEAVSDYANSNERQRRAADAGLARYLKEQLASFDPEHETPREIVPPRERWVVTTAMINV